MPEKDPLPHIQHAAEVDGIPIAAKFKGPGPVYSLPPTIGISAKFMGSRAPAFSFGVKAPLKDGSIGPGPAAFSPTVPGKSPSFSLQGGFKKTRRDGRAVIFGVKPGAEVDLDNPGPAKYHTQTVTSTSPRSPAYTIISRAPEGKCPSTPGPAAYPPPASIGAKQVTIPSPPMPTMAGSHQTAIESKSPGPAAYQSISPVKVGSAAPSYSLAKTVPGPGAYNPTLRTKQSAPVYSFRQKHSEYEHFVIDAESSKSPFIL